MRFEVSVKQFRLGSVFVEADSSDDAAIEVEGLLTSGSDEAEWGLFDVEILSVDAVGHDA